MLISGFFRNGASVVRAEQGQFLAVRALALLQWLAKASQPEWMCPRGDHEQQPPQRGFQTSALFLQDAIPS
jgi:hypothetical protein